MTHTNSYIFKLLRVGLGPVMSRDIFAALVRFLVTVIAARELSKDDFSSYIVVVMLASYCDVVFRVKTDQSVGYFIGKEIFDEYDVIKIQNTLILSSSTILCIALWGSRDFIEYYLSNSNLNINLIIIYLITYCILMQLYMAHVYLHLFKEDFDKYKNMTFISSGTLLLLVIIAKLTFINLNIILFSQSVGILFAVIYTAKYSNYMSHFKFSLNLNDLQKMIQYSGKLYLLNLVGILQTNYVVTLASFLLTTSAVGYVGLLRQFFQIAERIPGFFNQIFFGTMMREEKDKKEISIKISIITFILVSIIVIVLGFAMYPINKLLLDNKFPEILYYYTYLSPSICFFSATAPLILLLNSLGLISCSIFNYLISLGLSLLLGLMFYGQFTIETLGIMTLVYSVIFLGLTVRSVRLIRIS